MYKYFRCHLFRRQNIISGRTYSSRQTHYEVLNLRPTCSTKEIRDSFLKLSKKYHPDVQGASNDAKKTAKFVKINEAYNVLSKKSSREFYDLSLYSRHTTASSMRPEGTTASWTHFYSPHEDPNPGPYYGVEGIKKVSNKKVALFLLVFAAVGTALEFLLVRDKLDEVSKLAGERHAAARAEAKKYSNEKQLERFTEQILKCTEK